VAGVVGRRQTATATAARGVFAASPGGLAPPTAMVMTAGLAR
jgi:hypothetical protein